MAQTLPNSQGSKFLENSLQKTANNSKKDHTLVNQIATKKSSNQWSIQGKDQNKVKKDNADLGEINDVRSEDQDNKSLKSGKRTSYLKDYKAAYEEREKKNQ